MLLNKVCIRHIIHLVLVVTITQEFFSFNFEEYLSLWDTDTPVMGSRVLNVAGASFMSMRMLFLITRELNDLLL